MVYVIFCLYPSLWYKHLYPQSHKNTFIVIENPWYLKEVYSKSKSFPFSHKKNFNPKVIIISKLFLTKLSPDTSDSSYVLDSLLKAKIFPCFSAGNSFLFFSRFWNVKLSNESHFISCCKFSCLKKANTIIFNFFVLYTVTV